MEEKVQHLGIMFVDLSGYTALTAIHGPLEAFTVADKFQQMANASLVGNTAIIERVGDEILFTSAFAEDLLSTLFNLRFRTLREPNFLRIKAGMHYGEALRVENRLYGNTINIAARITSKAMESEILCSFDFLANLPKNKQALFNTLGMFNLKNIMHPLEVFRLVDYPTTKLISEKEEIQFYMDPVCHMLINPSKSLFVSKIGTQKVLFCSAECKELFDEKPSNFTITSEQNFNK